MRIKPSEAVGSNQSCDLYKGLENIEQSRQDRHSVQQR